jgi:hypothetical protein
MIMSPEGTMTVEEKMAVDDRRKYLRKMKKRYVKAARRKRGQLFDDIKSVTGMHRKSLVPLIPGF